VTLVSAVVASLVSSFLGALGTDVSHLATVEATTVLRPRLVDDLSVFTLQSFAGAIAGNVATFAAVVASLVTTAAAASAAAASTTATTATASTSTTRATLRAKFLVLLGDGGSIGCRGCDGCLGCFRHVKKGLLWNKREKDKERLLPVKTGIKTYVRRECWNENNH
jgi:hypothetical protein